MSVRGERSDPVESRRLSRRALLAGGASLPFVAAAGYALIRSGGPVGPRPLGSTATVAPSPSVTSAGPAAGTEVELRAAPRTVELVSGTPTTVWSYADDVPGPEIRVVAGQRVRVRVDNSLPQSTAVHWHGVSIDNAMDGVPGLTQDPIEPAGVFDYDFVAPHPGTYWYHSHDRSWQQNARGLHGVLVVEEPEPYPVERDLTVVVDDWRVTEDGEFDQSSLGNAVEWSHGGRMGDLLTLNGRVRPVFHVAAGERVRVRLVNVANARMLGVAFPDHPTTIIALDGHPTEPRPVDDYVLLAPGQRADVVVDMVAEPGSAHDLVLVTQNGSTVGATLRYAATDSIRPTFSGVAPLPGRPVVPTLDVDDARRLDLLMEGGAMGSMRAAVLDGRRLDVQQLADERRYWAFNGVAGDLDEPLATVARGRSVVVTIRNDTAFPHAMHLHGHHFEVLARDGAPDPWTDRRDTELVGAGETVEIGFVADNPGRWMLHCHMLEHAASGMATWLEVT